MKPSTQALNVAMRTWAETGPTVDPDRRLRVAVEAAFAQHRPEGNVGWQAVVMLAILAGFVLGLIALLG